eukprot:Gb_23242 [translate_table: standard]
MAKQISLGASLTPTIPTPFPTSSGSTDQFGSSPTLNPTILTSVGGPNPMPFGLPQYKNYAINLGVVPGMPNSYGFNGGVPYAPYPAMGHHFNNMMQYPMARNSFNFGNPFASPFTDNNGTTSGPTPSNDFGGIENNGHNGNSGNGGYINGNNSDGGRNNNSNDHSNNNGSGAYNGPSMFEILNTSLQHLKYEGYGDLFEYLALFFNNIAQEGIANKIAIKQSFFSTLREIGLQWSECIKENSRAMIKEQFLDCFQIVHNPSDIYKAPREIKEATKEPMRNYDGISCQIEKKQRNTTYYLNELFCR